MIDKLIESLCEYVFLYYCGAILVGLFLMLAPFIALIFVLALVVLFLYDWCITTKQSQRELKELLARDISTDELLEECARNNAELDRILAEERMAG